MTKHSVFSQHPALSDDENRVYRNFNIFLFIALADLAIVAAGLATVQPSWPFYMCLIEFVLLGFMLFMHVKGFFISARYLTFILAAILQTMASITHGKEGGFDYLFFCICVLPMMFFESRKHYISLFAISLSAYLGVQYTYQFVDPIIDLNSNFPIYWNTFVTASILFGVMFVFKRGYQRKHRFLLEQNSLISEQKTEIEFVKNNLEQLVVERTERIVKHENLLLEYAYVNAHRVRSPLARVMGLLTLMELENDKEKAMKELMPLLKENAEALTSILDQVSESLNAINATKTSEKS